MTTRRAATGTSARILIVDDNPIVRETLRMCIENLGCVASERGSAEEALDSIAREVPDLILLDLRLPGMSGIELCRQLKADRATRLVPIVLLTAEGDLQKRVAGLEAGADDFFTKPVHPRELAARVNSLVRLRRLTEALEHAENMLASLALTIEARDNYTGGHCVRLAMLAVELGERLGLDDEELDALQLGGFLHDLGKIAVPDGILLKPGPLDREQWRIMREHSEVGDRLAAPMRTLLLVRPIIRHHHERVDGRGYPDKLVGQEIPHLAKIMAVVDVYDALRTRRPYKPPHKETDSIRQLEEAARTGHLDPDLVRLFVEMRTRKSAGTSLQN